MQFLKPLLLIVILLTNQCILAQSYTPPVDFNMLLSGTFGELRSNHFHAGIDIKTEGVEGQKVRAIADGYISRIKVSSWGYGKVIYLTHPETGHTSVYAHLKAFSDRIDELVKKEHYKKESFEINFYPNKDALLINQGEIIALSGNSGSSNGAHLHFEIRDSKSERPINPFCV
jgi:murein DD-endopeptidase MepM/ murein hydrolase activator NlpD